MHSFSSAVNFSEHLLSLSSDATLGDARFHSLNFRLEQALPVERTASYTRCGGGDIDLGAGTSDDQVGQWTGHHNAYLKLQVRGWLARRTVRRFERNGT